MGLTGLRRNTEKKDLTKSFKRKFEKKLHFYAKVKDAVVSLGVKKEISKKKRLRSRQKKQKAYNLSSLAEFLPGLDAPPRHQNAPLATVPKKLSCKSRHKLFFFTPVRQKEGTQLAAVLSDPSFQVDPISAIHQFLERSQPPPTVTQEKKRERSKRDKGKKKPARRPPSSGPQSMET